MSVAWPAPAPWSPGLFDDHHMRSGRGSEWEVVSGSDPRALALVDGTHPACGGVPHYSRQHPGSPTFTGSGNDLVLVTRDGLAVWAVVENRMNGAEGVWLFRNNVFRRVGETARASDLIRSAVEVTMREWLAKYGDAPRAPLTTEVDAKKVRRKRDPGRCYIKAGWRLVGKTKRRGLLIFQAPEWTSA